MQEVFSTAAIAVFCTFELDFKRSKKFVWNYISATQYITYKICQSVLHQLRKFSSLHNIRSGIRKDYQQVEK